MLLSLQIGESVSTVTNGSLVTNYLAQPGRVVVAGEEPLHVTDGSGLCSAPQADHAWIWLGGRRRYTVRFCHAAFDCVRQSQHNDRTNPPKSFEAMVSSSTNTTPP